MTDMKNYTEVLIDGKIYTLGGTEDEHYLHRVAAYINEKITMLKSRKGFIRQSAEYQQAMIELNLADDYFKAIDRAAAAEKRREDMEKESYSLKRELVNLQMSQENLQKEVERLQKELEKR